MKQILKNLHKGVTLIDDVLWYAARIMSVSHITVNPVASRRFKDSMFDFKDI